MKRHGSSDSMAGLIPLSHQTLDESDSHVRDLDEDVDVGQISEKKRRLSVDQVKALEKNFDTDNKLEPERKVKLAQQLGLQPRQVAVWFQNRRARWKTKQLEKDYGVLKANFDSLNHNYDSLKQDNETLLKQIMELKSNLYGEGEGEDKPKSPEKMVAATYIPDFKDGSSDSDSSAILNEDNNSSNMVFIADVMNCNNQLTESKAMMEDAYEPKIEEVSFFSGDDESCNYFTDDQPPMLQWYSQQDHWTLSEEN